MKRELERIKSNPEFLRMYNEGMSLLFQSGLLDFLRILGQPEILAHGKDVQVMATQAARSAGWHGCLNMLLNFPEVLLALTNEARTPGMEFNGITNAVKRGDLMEGEADAIRNGTGFNPAIYQPVTTSANRTAAAKRSDS